ncbi:ABC transporter ATP-binding protein [Candidatus Nomurabacteria bacterium]|nr:ABC transporter ATP-binding protein [Candidatus Kaiserbacteria bacterium]MCB9810216.1 ABC transporter ATP-binding protein [Candidatus Nomurabacteria bacterium]MCB9818136.1 ABC transporter ATP-binding protein [Candidatus Nomurabacteria bacterium]
MAKPLIIARDLSIIYNKGKSNEFKALSGVSTDIFEGEYIILFGPSGCGKSTLMYSIQGSLPPGEGTLLIKGDDVYSYPPAERVYFQRYVMGIIFQSFNLIPSLSVLDNVALPMIFCDADKTTRDRRAQSLLDRFGVGHVSHKIPAMLSGGQQQRVSVSRSMVNDPKILLADEPTGNLDSVSTQQVMDKIDEINTFDRRTIIMVSHNAAHLSYAHRVYYLKDGKVVREVVNPQRKQIKPVREGETIVTELEQLARLFPYDSVETLRVKSLVNYLTQDYSFDQLMRLEKATSLFIQGKIDRDSYIKSLILPLERGGVQVDEKEARRMSTIAQKMITQGDDIRRYRARKDNDGIFFSQHKLAERMKEHLIHGHRIKLSKDQDKNMVEMIADRVTGVIEDEEMNERMMKGVRSGGMALSEKEADDLTRYFEKVIAQGVDVNYKN